MRKQTHIATFFMTHSLFLVFLAGGVLLPLTSQAASETFEQASNLDPDEFFTQAERDLIKRIKQQFEAEPSLASATEDVDIVHVHVERGEVVLWGAVESAEEKAAIGKRVQDVRGVNTVYNRLEVSGKQELSAAETSTEEPAKGPSDDR